MVINKYGKFGDKEDLYEAGVLGLMKAYKNYKKDVKFSSYAYYYILGEVTKCIRYTNGFNINYDDIKLYKSINKYIDEYKRIKGKTPDYERVSQDLGIPKKKIIDLEIGINYIEHMDDDKNYDKYLNTNNINIESIDLKESFKHLTEDERKIIKYHYYEGYTESEIAKHLGTTQVEISRSESKILKKLRAYN